LSKNAKVERYGFPIKSSLALRGEDEVSYELFTWVRNLEIGIGWFAENASLLSKNAKVEHHGSTVKSSFASWSKVEVRKQTSPLFVRQG